MAKKKIDHKVLKEENTVETKKDRKSAILAELKSLGIVALASIGILAIFAMIMGVMDMKRQSDMKNGVVPTYDKSAQRNPLDTKLTDPSQNQSSFQQITPMPLN